MCITYINTSRLRESEREREMGGGGERGREGVCVVCGGGGSGWAHLLAYCEASINSSNIWLNL